MHVLWLLQYLSLRFGPQARTCTSLLYSLQMVLYMGIVVYAPALALEALTGLSHAFSIILVGAVCMFYCTLGGMKAVIVTDVFQVKYSQLKLNWLCSGMEFHSLTIDSSI